MKLSSSCFQDNERIPEECAFAVYRPEQGLAHSQNLNPDFAWSDLPERTRSLVLVCHDPDVPTVPENVNRAGYTITADVPRVDLYHWALVDIPPELPGIRKGEFSSAVVVGGKAGPAAPNGTRQGLNDYTAWFANDEHMKGEYFGYDGPCPPWNDALPHRYIFTLYALDTPKCPLTGAFRAREVTAAIEPFVLASATLTGYFTTNPSALRS